MVAVEPTFVEASDAQRLVTAPVVSVLMLAYNHGPYLAEAIEGVLSQQCDFDYELLIGEDASTDDTRVVAMRYCQSHPERVRVVCSNHNVGAHANYRRLLGLSRGEFIAYCEGDDYWCRSDKLERQVALLRAEPTAAIVHSDWVRAKQYHGTWRVEAGRPVHRRVPGELLRGDLFPVFYFPKILRTCTVVQRRSALSEFHASEFSVPRYPFGDTVKAAFFTARWPVAYWPEVSAVYRESPGSVLRSGRRARLAFLRSCLEFDSAARDFFRSRADYPEAYRWECAMGLLFKALRMGDIACARLALDDLRAHYGLRRFMGAAIASARMRWPSR